MQEQEIFDKLVAIVTPYVKNRDALETLSPTTNLLDDLEVNSARLVDIVLAIEDEFDIEVGDDDAERVTTFGDGVRLIAERMNGNAD